MNKKHLNIILISSIFILFILIFRKYQQLGFLVTSASLMFITKAMPFLFIASVLNNLLIEFNLPYYLNKIFPNKYLYIMLMSTLSGSPINAIILDKLLKEKVISEKEASITLAFTTLNNPLFLYNYFNVIFKNQYITLKLFLIIYLSNIIMYLVLAKKLQKDSLELKYKPINPAKALTNSLTSSGNSMLNIFLAITLFYTLSSLLTKSAFLKGLIEITTGLEGIAALNALSPKKELLTLVILNFAGLSIHTQIASILSEHNINYKYFYLSRIFHIGFSVIAALVL